MSGGRILGQDTNLLLVVAGIVKSTITSIKSFEINVDMSVISEGYIGEKSDRKDDIFKGLKCSMEFHYENRDILDLITYIIERAQRQVPGTQVNIKTTLNFPDGTKARVILQDMKFGAIPVGFGGRDQYGTVKLDCETGNAWRVL